MTSVYPVRRARWLSVTAKPMSSYGRVFRASMASSIPISPLCTLSSKSRILFLSIPTVPKRFVHAAHPASFDVKCDICKATGMKIIFSLIDFFKHFFAPLRLCENITGRYGHIRYILPGGAGSHFRSGQTHTVYKLMTFDEAITDIV